jgi:hypothetical protein
VSIFSVPADEPAVIVNVPVVPEVITTGDTGEEPATPDRVIGMSTCVPGASLAVTVMVAVVAPAYILAG